MTIAMQMRIKWSRTNSIGQARGTCFESEGWKSYSDSSESGERNGKVITERIRVIIETKFYFFISHCMIC